MCTVPDSKALLLLALLCGGCASAGPYLWVDQLPPPLPAEGYVIAVGDSLNVRVWNQDAVSAKVKVRSDGQITLPLVNDVTAAGLTPEALAQMLQTRLKDFLTNPLVTVSLEQTGPLGIPVLGEVAKPGIYLVETGTGLLPLLAAAGGLTEWAGRDRIYVLRPGSPALRIRFRFQDVARAEGGAGWFRVQAGDQIVVE